MVTNIDPRTKNVRYLNTAIFLSVEADAKKSPPPLPHRATKQLFALVSAVAELSCSTHPRPAQRTQAKPGLGWRSVRARNRRRLRVPTRSILQPISGTLRPSPSPRPQA